MLHSTRQPYICWRCFVSPAESAAAATTRYSRRQFVPRRSRSHFTFVRKPNGISLYAQGSIPPASGEVSDVRKRLQAWEKENQSVAQTLLDDLPFSENLGNFLTRPQTVRTFSDDTTTKLENADMYDGDVLGDLRGQTSALLAGDLVEARFNGRLPVLGICLGRHHGQQYFYMNTGEVVSYKSLTALFTLTGYMDSPDLEPLVRLLPEEPYTKPRNVLSHVHTPEALDLAAKLQDQLTKFYADAVSFGQVSLHYLDKAGEKVALPNTATYLTLEEMADRLLPKFLKTGNKFHPSALYAVHLALQRDGWATRPVNMKWHRRNYIYEIQPKSDIELLRDVEAKVRKLVDGAALRDNPGSSMSLLQQNSLGRFILRARAAIQKSRSRRPWTPHGMVGPGNGAVDELPRWDDSDLKYIRFLELWACRRVIPEASQIDSLASTILRLTQMYSEDRWAGHWTGFTFLQEIGWIPPWDIPARYDYRFPGVEVSRGDKLIRPGVDVEASLRPDIASEARRDWGNVKIFCVDSEQTADVDDGFSIERTDRDGEYWIHVHIADPSSRIDPKSSLAQYLENMPSSLYLAGFSEKMLPPALEQEFSLNPGKPVLTFSAKVNEHGDILEHAVEPGTVQNVVHMPKHEVSSILPALRSEPSSAFSNEEAFSVGTEPGPPAPVKKITKADELTRQDREDLLLLDRLGTALKDRRVEKGQLPGVPSRLPSPEVSFPPASPSATDPGASTDWIGDPFISFSRSSPTAADRLVERLMHTTGEVAARWCQARGIPVPYSTQPEALRNASELSRLRREVVDPLTQADKPVPMDLLHQLFTLIGTSELSSSPAPFYSVGIDAYAKASSPLRHYTDLMVHWQIHAALAHERSTGQSLLTTSAGSTGGADPDSDSAASCAQDAEVLPFTCSSLDPVLPVLQARQRQIREVDNRDGPMHWILQALLRAWKFGEAPLPDTFVLHVDAVLHFGFSGCLANFHDLPALVPLSLLSEKCKLSDVAVGDRFEVRIADINTVTRDVWVEVLGRVEREG